MSFVPEQPDILAKIVRTKSDLIADPQLSLRLSLEEANTFLLVE